MSAADPLRSTDTGRRDGEPLSRADRYVVTMLAALLGGTVLGFVGIGGQLVGLQRQVGDLRVDMTREIGALSARVDTLSKRVDHLTVRMERVEGRLTSVEGRLTSVEGRLTSVEGRLTGVEGRLTSIEAFIQTHHGPLPGR